MTIFQHFEAGSISILSGAKLLFRLLFENDPSDSGDQDREQPQSSHHVLFCGTMSATNRNLFTDAIRAIVAAAHHYSSVKDDRSLRGVVHEAGRSQSVVLQALQAANSNLGDRKPAEKTTQLLKACYAKATVYESVWKEIAQAPEPWRFEHYKVVVRNNKGNRVEVLLVGMMKDMCELVGNDIFKVAMDDQVRQLRDAIDKLSTMEPSVPAEETGHTFTNWGRDQINAPGGTVNRSDGSGNQFTGATFYGSLEFGAIQPK